MGRAVEGEPVLRDLFDFARKPGTRNIVRDYLLESFAYIDHLGQVGSASTHICVRMAT